MGYKDSHHVLHNRAEWTLRPQGRALREIPTLVPVIDRDLHETIHANVPPVPLLGYHALQLTLANFNEGWNTLESVGNLQTAIEQAGKHRRAHPVERELGDLAIHALDLQKPYLRPLRAVRSMTA